MSRPPDAAPSRPPRPRGISRRVREVRALGVGPSIRQVTGRLLGFPIAPSFRLTADRFRGQTAVEIGGPTILFRGHRPFPVYPILGPIDVVDYAPITLWGGSEGGRDLPPGPPGLFRRAYQCEASRLDAIANSEYGVLLASHVLEHLANPLGALAEWRRVVRPGGSLVLVLPDGRRTFDHRRPPTPLDHLAEDSRSERAESDQTHVPEILALHDLEKDPGAGTMAEFRERAAENLRWRALHHHVFHPENLRATVTSAGFEVVALDEVEPHHLILVAARSG